MADISKITLPSGTTYDIKDAHARELIDEMSSYTDFLGVTTTALSDGATTNPIKINNADVTAKKGNIVTYGSAEFIFNGTAWQAFGDLSGLGSLAYKNSASGSTTVAVPKTYTTTVTPKAKDVSVSGTTTGSVSVTKGTVTVSKASSGTATYTPAGTNASSSVSGSCTVTPSGSISTGTGTANYTPAGTNASSSVSGSCTVTPSGSISTGTGTANYTPAGSVSAPTISVKTAGSTTTIKNPTSKTVVTDMSVSAPASGTATGELVYCSVSNETLSLSKFIETTGASITTSNVTVKNGDAAYQSSKPSFTGTGAELKFTGSSSSGTISGTAAAQTFTGTGAQLKFTGSSSSGTISGTAAAQTFTGTGARLVTDSEVATGASFVGASMTSTGSYTPATPTASTTTATTENKTVSITVS